MSEEGKSKDKRKVSKPIMEKRRRARINESLNELKSLILEAMRKDNSCYSKLEKADVLEMTVQHLKNLRNQGISGNLSSSPASQANYRAGFNQCASEITRVVMGLETTETSLRARLLEHLATRLVNKPEDTADTRGQTLQVVYPNQTILPKPSIPSTVSHTMPFVPQASPSFLPATSYQLANSPLTNAKVAFLLPTINPFLVSSSPQTAQPSFIPLVYKDPKQQLGPATDSTPIGFNPNSMFGSSLKFPDQK